MRLPDSADPARFAVLIHLHDAPGIDQNMLPERMAWIGQALSRFGFDPAGGYAMRCVHQARIRHRCQCAHGPASGRVTGNPEITGRVRVISGPPTTHSKSSSMRRASKFFNLLFQQGGLDFREAAVSNLLRTNTAYLKYS